MEKKIYALITFTEYSSDVLELGFSKKELQKVMSEHTIQVPELEYAVIPATVSFELPASVIQRMKKTTKQKYQIKTSGVLVRKQFDTHEEAHAWGEWNYKGDKWEIVTQPTNKP